MKKENIISIQSQVFDGFCGNNIAAFVFRRRGHIPKILNTVQYYSKFKHSGVELNSQEVDIILIIFIFSQVISKMLNVLIWLPKIYLN
ncbi:hypothetical protein PFFCH_01415 [Plasmodium falciparum FCH/4]|uniref:pyridoxal kinase n=1 Tax=Plasmodium falciparum FCH/4 TaxID=1036724 RepID=A0A024VRR1_PLAFA|nr:hypothetical protein PFFCH_01415 [Plasmodium falciparum FCH/4]